MTCLRTASYHQASEANRKEEAARMLNDSGKHRISKGGMWGLLGLYGFVFQKAQAWL